MSALSVAGLAIISVLLSLLMRQYRPVFALVIGIASGGLILFMALGTLSDIFITLNGILSDSGIDGEWMGILVRCLGLTYIFTFASDCAREAGEFSVAGRIDVYGKIAVLICAVPIITKVVAAITGFIGD